MLAVTVVIVRTALVESLLPFWGAAAVLAAHAPAGGRRLTRTEIT